MFTRSLASNQPDAVAPARAHGRSSSTWLSALIALPFVLAPGLAQAGPVEAFLGIALHPTDPHKIVVPYINGLSGLFLSSDGGKTFRLRNSEALTLMPKSYFPRDNIPVLFTSDTLLVGGEAGLLSSDAETCGLTEKSTLLSDWVNAVAAHPTDASLAFIASTKANAPRGGLFKRASSGELTALGADDSAMMSVDDLKVVTRADSMEHVRIVEVGQGTAPVLRYTDDLGSSWTERALPGIQASAKLWLSVDPLNPDVFLVVGNNPLDNAGMDPVDDVLLSTDAGKAFTPYLSGLVDARYSAFAPDGRFWLGDLAGGLYQAQRLGQPAAKVADLPVHCLAFDASQDALLMCKAYELGRFNPQDKSYCQMFRIYEATGFPNCPSEMPLADPKTQDQLCQSYCNSTHYWYAPFCAQYSSVPYCGSSVLQTEFSIQLPASDDTPRCAGFVSSYRGPDVVGGADAGQGDGGAASADAGSPSGSDAGTQAVDAGNGSESEAGVTSSSDAGTAPADRHKGRCSVTSASASPSSFASAWVWGLALCALWLRRSDPRRARTH